jgi:hypothetical protein
MIEASREHDQGLGAESAATSEATPPDIGIARGVQFRVNDRYEVEGDAEVVIKDGNMGPTLLRGSILDISISGCYIQTLARVPLLPETEVEIIFSVYGSTFKVAAVSRYAKTRVGIGFRFLEMDDNVRQRLHAVLADIRSKLIDNDPKGPLPIIERVMAGG